MAASKVAAAREQHPRRPHWCGGERAESRARAKPWGQRIAHAESARCHHAGWEEGAHFSQSEMSCANGRTPAESRHLSWAQLVKTAGGRTAGWAGFACACPVWLEGPSAAASPLREDGACGGLEGAWVGGRRTTLSVMSSMRSPSDEAGDGGASSHKGEVGGSAAWGR